MQVAERVIEIIKETEKQTPKLRAIVQHNKEEVLKVIKLMHCTFVVTRCCPADLPHLQCNLWCFCYKEVVLPVRVSGWPTSQPPAWAHWSLLFDLAQEPITRSVQLPYCVCETAFSQVNLFLDKLFPRIC